METVRKIVELALAKRDEAGIKVRQPLAQLIVQGAELSIELSELIKDEVNVKEVVYEKADLMSVKLNTELTAELKEEGMYRELVRTINQLRKEAKLTIQDKVEIYYQTDSVIVQTVIKNFNDDLLNNTLSSSIQNQKSEGNLIEQAVKVNGEEFWLALRQ